MQVDWKSEYSLGIPQMDAEHYKMIELMSRIEEAKGRPDELQMVWKVLADLQDYLSMHFLHEEDLMEHAGYPDLESHKAQHRAFRKRIEDLKFAPVDASTLHKMLRDWLAEHILKVDRAYVLHVRTWMNKRGGVWGPE